MSAEATTPDTIVLIRGFWVTPRSWEHWKARYEDRGYRVLAPAYPGFEGPHLLPAAPGWEQVADHALDWAVQHAGQRQPVA